MYGMGSTITEVTIARSLIRPLCPLTPIDSIVSAAEGHSFVMNSVLAFAATHLAWLTDSMETKNLAYYHRGVALKGLHDAIGNFSRESSDAILAASILLSWQTTDW